MSSSLIKVIIGLLFSCFVVSNAAAKDIRKPALNLAYEHFAYSAVLEILSGNSEFELGLKKNEQISCFWASSKALELFKDPILPSILIK